MQNHGLADFPDPDSSGTIDIKASGVDPTTAAFRSAQKACEALEPSGFSPGTHVLSAAERQRSLAYSRCMRAHGIPSFPDPDSSGRLTVGAIRTAGLDPDSPLFQTAMTACERFKPPNIVVRQ